jgi:hypothetical protein
MRALWLSLPLVACACSAPSRGEGVPVGATSEPLTAVCEADVRGVGTIPVETQYLPHVVHCENGGAPLEALRVQAIAARTYLYYKIETSGSIGDGQGDQVYSCGSGPDAQQVQAAKDTEGLVLRYKNETIASFFVAGGTASPPACKDSASSTSAYVTYNAGLSGANIHQTSLGYESPTNYRNRGCMSQLGSRCLANEGKSYEDILKFYYGDDIVLERADGPCVTPPPAPHDGGTDAAVRPPDDAAPPPPPIQASPGTPSAGDSGCNAAGRQADGSWLIVIALAALYKTRSRPRHGPRTASQASRC